MQLASENYHWWWRSTLIGGYDAGGGGAMIRDIPRPIPLSCVRRSISCFTRTLSCPCRFDYGSLFCTFRPNLLPQNIAIPECANNEKAEKKEKSPFSSIAVYMFVYGIGFLLHSTSMGGPVQLTQFVTHLGLLCYAAALACEWCSLPVKKKGLDIGL